MQNSLFLDPEDGKAFSSENSIDFERPTVRYITDKSCPMLQLYRQ
jgi:hypothetical protein